MKRLLPGILFIIISFTLLLAGCGGDSDDAASWITVFEDNFNRSDSDLGSNYNLKIESGTTFQIESQEVKYYNESSGTGGDCAFYTGFINNPNTRLSIRFTTGSDLNFDPIALNARSFDSSGITGYCLALIPSMLIIAKDDGIFLNTQSLSSIATNTTYILEFIIEGSSLTGYIKTTGGDIIAEISTSDSTSSSGYMGFSTEGSIGTTVYFDDFKIEIR